MGKWNTNAAGRARFANPANVVSNVIDNPKRGASAKRYALYAKLGKSFTVAKYIEAVEKAKLGNATLAQNDICWDAAHKFIQVAPAKRSGANVAAGKGGVSVPAVPAAKVETPAATVEPAKS